VLHAPVRNLLEPPAQSIPAVRNLLGCRAPYSGRARLLPGPPVARPRRPFYRGPPPGGSSRQKPAAERPALDEDERKLCIFPRLANPPSGRSPVMTALTDSAQPAPA